MPVLEKFHICKTMSSATNTYSDNEEEMRRVI